MRKFWNILRIVTLLVVLAFAPIAIWRGFATENYARFWMALVLPMLSIVVLAQWYLIFGWGRFVIRAKRFGIFALVAVVGWVTFRGLLRYEGSTGGTSLPRFVWRWSPTESETAAAVERRPRAAPKPVAVEPVDGAVDSAQFYGPNRDATWPAKALLASFDWSAENAPEEIWRQPVGQGWSGFSVVGRRALTMEQHGDEEVITCRDLLTGEMLWTHGDEARYYNSAATKVKEMAGDGPRAVPTVSGDRVYTYGATGVLNCLSLETGEVVWQRRVFTEIGNPPLPEWGKSTSPLVMDDLGLVVVSGAENRGPTLLAYAAETGEPVWRYEGNGASYSSPRLLTLTGKRQIVSVNGHDVSGHDPATGAELWRFDWPGQYPKVAQPILIPGDRLLVTASYGAGSFLLQISREGEAWAAEKVWRTIRLKTKFSSPVVLDGYAYALDEGRLACFDLADGSRKWKAGKYGFGQNLLLGDRLLIQAEAGYLAVVEANPEAFREIARLDALTYMTWNPPTLAGRYLLVRNDKEAVCFRLPPR